MDLTTTLQGNAFRPFATLVAPGSLGLAPWALLAYAANIDVQEFWDKHPIATGVALFILSVAAGLVFEDIGSRIETKIDERMTAEDSTHGETWRRYLLVAFGPNEPVGQRYLRTILFRLKFELAMLASMPVQVLGWLLILQRRGTAIGWLAALAVGGALLAMWFHLEARESAAILARTRKDLVEHFGKALPTA